MLNAAHTIRELEGLRPDDLTGEILASTRPLVLRGLVSGWPLVKAGRESLQAADAYLRRFYRGTPVNAMLGPPGIEGRFFYNDDLSGFNFAPVRTRLDTVFAELAGHLHDEHPPALYVGSTDVDLVLPGLRAENDLPLGERNPLNNIWIGNRTRIAAHYDLPDNIACVAAGRRRFTLFPPEQLANLYVGPLDLTPAGQAISLVDFAHPDLATFPRFEEAMRHAQVAELDAGDAVFIPSMWWHHVEALERFNILVNYWWRRSPEFMDTPMNALMLAVLTVRDLPREQREAWRNLFNHYVFDAAEEKFAHIPANARRVLAPLDDDTARALRAQLLKRLNR
jgi:hypothetical protein